jgi:phosphatidylglycerophosphatase C
VSRPVAAFDFDGTITRSDTLVPFLALIAGWPRVVGAAVRHAPSFRDRDRAKERVLRTVLAGRAETELRRLGREYASELPNRFRPELLDRIDWHRREGHELVIVSASLRYYLDHVAKALGIGTVIGVEMEVVDGRLTGELARPNVRGPEKARRLKEWWGDRPATELWAYGNSSGDEALLALADHPTWVGR